jgi:malate dehydrogenase (oxaloacetate-decarboxylating)
MPRWSSQMPDAEHTLTIRTELPAAVGTFGQVMEAIGGARGEVGGVDLVSAGQDRVVRDITVQVADDAGAMAVQEAISALPGVEIKSVLDRVFAAHVGGKMTMRNRVPVATRDDLAMAYTPGVARVCMAIHDEPERAWDYTIKGNSVMVVSDGSSVVGQGDLGPEASLPAVEAKCVFLRELAGVDGFPLPITERDPDKMADIIVSLSSVFAGIHLTDIAAPRCFELAAKLRERLDIPVLHDDQEGTAAALLAALTNGLRIADKTLEDSTIVVAGLGPGGMSIVRILIAAGVGKNLIACDRRGAVTTERSDLTDELAWVAANTNPEGRQGTAADLVEGADAFIGLSSPGILSASDVATMADDPVVLTLAMPEPELSPADAAGIAGVYGTGRPDVPNQINSALAFPGIWRGALDCRARHLNQAMIMAAARAIADTCGPALSDGYVVPSVLNPDLVDRVAKAVRTTAEATGAARAWSL